MKGVKGSETKRLIREAAYKQFLTKRLQHGSPEGDRKKSEFIKRMYVISLSKQARTVY